MKKNDRQKGHYPVAVFHYDEGDVTSGKVTGDFGLASALREIWSTGSLKQGRGSASATRMISNVGIGLTMGIQPGNHCAIIDDQWGLNERALYAIVYDPDRPSYEERLHIPEIEPMESIEPRSSILSHQVDQFIEELQDALIDDKELPDWAQSISRRHGDLNLMKLAALASCFRNPDAMIPTTVEFEDFRLGLLLAEMSHASRQLHEQEQTKKRDEDMKKSIKTQTNQKALADAMEATSIENRLEKAKIATRMKIISQSNGEGFTKTQANNWCSLSSAKLSQMGFKRGEFITEILEDLEAQGAIDVRDGRFYLR